MISIWLYQLTSISLFEHRMFRAGAASLVAASLVFLIMPRYIRWLNSMDATSDFENSNALQKNKVPPIFGGALILFAVLISTLFFTVMNGYSISILLIMTSYAIVGGFDDVMKIRTKYLIRSGILTKKDYQDKADGLPASLRLVLYFAFSAFVSLLAYKLIPGLNRHLAIPFIKPDLWYPLLPAWAFIALMCFVTTASANGANFTDGLDSLVSVPLITCALFIGLVAYISGNVIFSKYFLVPYLPGVDELLPICCAMVGALLAYLWYNCPPAEIYMGDAGSIGLGGAIGMMFVMIKAELFLPIIGVIFVLESLSVAMQIGYFKWTKKFSADKQGKRIFRRAPIHDHFKILMREKTGLEGFQLNSKIIWRFHLISVLSLILGLLIFFKIR